MAEKEKIVASIFFGDDCAMLTNSEATNHDDDSYQCVRSISRGAASPFSPSDRVPRVRRRTITDPRSEKRARFLRLPCCPVLRCFPLLHDVTSLCSERSRGDGRECVSRNLEHFCWRISDVI